MIGFLSKLKNRVVHAETTTELPVLVRQSAIKASKVKGEEYELALAVMEYVNALTIDGCYRSNELPPETVHAVGAERYLGEVNNGGHRQFVLNSGADYLLKSRDALSGLVGMGATEHAALLTAMMDWTAQNSELLAKSQEDFGPSPDFIDELDMKFYKLEERAPMAVLSSKWISTWVNLKAVDDSHYEAEIQQLIASHPEHKSRLITKRVNNLDNQMTDRLLVSMGLAATHCDAPEMLLRITAGFYSRLVQEKRMAWCVETTHGWRHGVVSESGVAFYEDNKDVDHETEIEDEIADMTGEDEGRKLPEFAGVYLGRKLSEVSADQITQVANAAHRFDTSAALDLLLRKLGIEDQSVAASALYVTSLDNHSDSSRWVACVGDRFFTLHAVDSGARLAESEVPESLVEVSRAEIRLHRNAIS
jgi:Domain of unknown function (DUF4375)